MKKRILMILLSLSMIVALMPTMAFATGEGSQVVAKIDTTEYTTLAEALLAAESGDTIEVQEGSWGADEIGSMTVQESASVRGKSLTIQPADGAKVTFTSTVSLGYDDSSTTNASMTVKGIAFENASLAMCNYVQATVENCSFKGGSSSAGTLIISDSCCTNHKTEGDYPKAVVTVKNCTIDGSVANAPGIRIRNSGNVVIEGNTIKNTNHNGILFETNSSINATPVKAISVKGNTISEWNATNADEGGRAIRAAFDNGSLKLPSESTVDITGNTFTKAIAGLDSPDFIKITGDEAATTNLNDNCWDGATLTEVKGNSKIYTSKATSFCLTRVANKKLVAVVGEEEFSSLSAALLAAANNDTIEVQAGTWGAKEIGSMTISESASVRSKSLTIQPADGAKVTFTSTVSLGYDDSSTTNASMTVKGIAFENASLAMCNYVNATVENCSFKGGSLEAGTLIISDSCCTNHKTTGDYPQAVVTVKNCTIDGSVANAPGIRIRNSGNVVIEGNTIKNTNHNGILFETNSSVNATPVKAISVKGNTISEWNATNADEGGRAIRAAFDNGSLKLPSESTVDITGNTFAKAQEGLDSPDFIKLTGATAAAVDLSNNNWNGATLAEVRGNKAIYTSDATNTSITSVAGAKTALVKIGDDEYRSIESAIAGAKDGDTLELLDNVTIKKNIEINKAITFDAKGKTITAADDIILNKVGENYGIIVITADASLKNAKLSFNTISHLARVNGVKFAGVIISNASASVVGCEIDAGITEKSQLGIQNGYGIYAVADDTETVTVSDTKVEKFNKGGIYAMTDKIALVVDKCDIVGFGAVDCQAQNGVVAMGTLKLTDTKISKIGYTGSDWSASGILAYGTSCELVDANIVMDNLEDYALYAAGIGSISGSKSVLSGEVELDNAAFEITNGIFTKDVAAYIPKGYTTVKNADNTYTVSTSSEVIGEQQQKIGEQQQQIAEQQKKMDEQQQQIEKQQEQIAEQQTTIASLVDQISKLGTKIELMLNPVKASVKISGKTAIVSWDAVDVEGVSYTVNGEAVSGTSVTLPVELGKNYSYTVKTFVGEVAGTSSTVTASTAPAKVATPTVKNVATKKLTTTWTATEGAAKYQLSVSTSSSASKVKIVYTGANLKYTKGSLTKGKYYYVRVRAVGENGVYGEWSAYKKIKLAK